MKEQIYVRDFVKLLMTYKKVLSIIMIASILCLIQLSFILPKTFKSDFELNIYSTYFKNALINDVLPGMNSIAEMTQTTDSMVKEAMSDEFLDSLGKEYHIYPEGIEEMSTMDLAKERQKLRNRFEMFSTGGQSYKISFTYGDPTVTYDVTKKVFNTVRNSFINKRIETIELAKKTIQQKLESVNVTKHIRDESISANALASQNPDVLRSEIAKINQDLSALKLQFNVEHPRIQKLEQRKATIENWLNEAELENSSKIGSREAGPEYTDAPLLMTGDKEISQNITSRLYNKFNDINVALDIERKSVASYIGVISAPQIPTSPLFPKKRLFASLGFLIGLVLCFGYVFYHEVIGLSSLDKTRELAENLDSEFMGMMPTIKPEELLRDDKRSVINGNFIKHEKVKDHVSYSTH